MHERMGELVAEHAFQSRRYRSDPANRDAKLAIIQAAGPGRRIGDVGEFLLGVKNDDDVFARFVAELPGNVLVTGLERGQNLLLQLRRRSFALIAEGEVAAFLAS